MRQNSNAPGMLKTLSVSELVESQVPDAVPVVHHARRVIIGFFPDEPDGAASVRESVDAMMRAHDLRSTFISKAKTRSGRVFILAHD